MKQANGSALKRLNQSDAVAMEAWLKQRLVDAYGPPGTAREEAESFIEFGIERNDTLVQALRLVYRKLSGNARAAFVAAIGNLFRHARRPEFPTQGMQDLMVLIAVTDAHHHLSDYESVLGSGAWGEEIPELFFYAIASLKSLTNGREAHAAARRLIGCRQFPLGYLFDAFEVMLESGQEHWADDLLYVAPGLERLCVQVAASNSEARGQLLERRLIRLVEQIVRVVTPERLAAGLRDVTDREARALSLDHVLGRLVKRLAKVTHRDEISDRLMLDVPGAKVPTAITGLSATAEGFLRTHCRPTIGVPQAPARPSVIPKKAEVRRRLAEAEAVMLQMNQLFVSISPLGAAETTGVHAP
ncbi:hypothetical protein [Steroidobacter cummioxidans]|uniref:hypothetical protein n=1 Tax=Steroidobacter cummioxidans TaxID=1803913 RepID=UPI000E31ABF2|nr:hypothetical protein [Steroidobacter cummioxidans]